MNRRFGYFVIVFLLTCIMGWNLFVYNSSEMEKSYFQAEDSIRNVDETEKSIILSYGPVQKMQGGLYGIFIKYETDTDENRYELYGVDNGGVVFSKEGFDSQRNRIGFLWATQKVDMQVLTYFAGTGFLHIKQIGMIPYGLLILAIISGLLLCAYVILLLLRQKTGLVGKLFQGGTMVYFAYCSYYIGTSGSEGAKNLASIICLVAFTVLLSLLFAVFDKEALIMLMSVLTIGIIEFGNILLCDLNYDVLFWTSIVSVLIFMACKLIKKNIQVCCIVVTLLFWIYSVAQCMYYQYFSDFFTLKIIKLFSTAMKASGSIAELLNGKILLFVFVLVLYIVGIVVTEVIYKKRSRNTIEGEKSL